MTLRKAAKGHVQLLVRLLVRPIEISMARTEFQEMIDATIKYILKAVFTLLYFVTYPIIKIRLPKRRYCPPIKNEILLCTASELSERIRKKKISSEDVVSIFIARCKEVNPIVNAIVEDRFEAALKEAREIDAFLRTTTRSEKEIERETPLLGIPITVKESIAVKGMSHAVGVKIEENTKAVDDADVVKRVRRAGGILLLVSNAPELCMSWETVNNVTGRTLNPYDTRRTPGGSTGGEAALLGSGASLLSLASDIAGSARLPAMFCGVFGHKPSPNWISCVGHRPLSTDQAWNSFFTISIMTRYSVDLPLLLRVISQNAECKISLTREVDLKSVKIYYIQELASSILASPVDQEIKKGIHDAVKHMETTVGCPIRKVELKNMKYAYEVSTSILLNLRNVESIFNLGDGTKEWKSVSLVALKHLCWMSSHISTSVHYGILVKVLRILPRSYWERIWEKHDLLKKEFQEMLGNDGVLICPTFKTAAWYHSELYSKLLDTVYLIIFNALGFPVTQCPIGLNKSGLPIGLQVVANEGCDHLTIAVAKQLERKFGGWKEPPADK